MTGLNGRQEGRKEAGEPSAGSGGGQQALPCLSCLQSAACQLHPGRPPSFRDSPKDICSSHHFLHQTCNCSWQHAHVQTDRSTASMSPSPNSENIPEHLCPLLYSFTENNWGPCYQPDAEARTTVTWLNLSATPRGKSHCFYFINKETEVQRNSFMFPESWKMNKQKCGPWFSYWKFQCCIFIFFLNPTYTSRLMELIPSTKPSLKLLNNTGPSGEFIFLL